MSNARRYVLGTVLLAVALATTIILFDVLATVFFAVTIATVLVPVDRWVINRGFTQWVASAVATAFAVLTLIGLFVPIGVILYLRRRAIVDYLSSLPDRLALEFAGAVYTLDVGEATALATQYVTRAAIGLGRSGPIIATKAIVFVVVVFGLLYRRDRVRRAVLAPVPPTYHDLVWTLYERIRATLVGLYVIQAATAAGTFVVAFGIFWLFGYQYAFALAVAAGILQFLPIVGPSLVVIAIAGVEAMAGAYGTAGAVLVVGLVFIGVVPDAVIRPRLAAKAANLSASLYFVGFTGGLLGVGPVGIIAGPLVVALLSEALTQLAAEMRGSEQ